MATTGFTPLTAEYVALDGTNFSDHVVSAELELEADEVDYDNMGSGGWHEVKAGMKSASLKLTLHQDFAASNIDATLSTAFFAGAAIAVELRPTNAAVSATNPKYTFNVRATKHQPIAGKVGDRADVSITLPITGAVTRATS